jgi:hypothetical protein
MRWINVADERMSGSDLVPAEFYHYNDSASRKITLPRDPSVPCPPAVPVQDAGGLVRVDSNGSRAYTEVRNTLPLDARTMANHNTVFPRGMEAAWPGGEQDILSL